MRGKLIVLSGPSGTGKGEICKKLIKQNKNLSLSVSLTTRKPRKNEEDGREYFFISKEEFEAEIANKGILEYANVYGLGNYYGTPKKRVLELIEAGKDILLEIDVEGGRQVKENYEQVLRIFVIPPTMEDLRKRIIGRGTEAEEVIDRRLNEAKIEIDAAMEEYDYLVINDKIEDAVKQIESIISAEKAKITEEIFTQLETFKEEK